MTCRGFLQCILKILNFFLTMVGAAMVLYSLWMMHEWYKNEVPSPAPAPVESSYHLQQQYTSGMKHAMTDLKDYPLLQKPMETVAETQPIQVVQTLSFVLDKTTARLKSSISLPAPWFIYAFLGAGIISLLVTCAGHIAAETASACCLCFYTVLLIILLVVQGAVTAAIFFDNNWKDDIPSDPTGQLENFYAFIEENYDICKWAGLAVLIIQALALLFSLILRAVADTGKRGYDSDDDYLPRTTRQTMGRQQTAAANGAAGDAAAEGRPPARSDEWSKRMREKYGLDTNEFTYNPSESRRYVQPSGAAAPTGEEKKGACTIM